MGQSNDRHLQGLLLTKQAFIGAAAKGLWGATKATGRGAANFGKGMLFMGPTSGAGAGAKAMNYAGKATAIGGPIAGSLMPQQSAKPGMAAGPFEMVNKVGSVKQAAIASALEKYAGISRREKQAFGLSDAADIASYSAFIGAKLTPHDHPLHAALDAAGLIGLGATTAHGMLTSPPERGPGAKDLLGLALMGSALYDRTTAPAPGH